MNSYSIVITTKLKTIPNVYVGIYDYVNKKFEYKIEINLTPQKKFLVIENLAKQVSNTIKELKPRFLAYIDKSENSNYIKRYNMVLGMIFKDLPDDFLDFNNVYFLKLTKQILSVYAVGKYCDYPIMYKQICNEFKINLPQDKEIIELFWGCLFGATYCGIPSIPRRELFTMWYYKGHRLKANYLFQSDLTTQTQHIFPKNLHGIYELK